jgi:hypothetical protein
MPDLYIQNSSLTLTYCTFQQNFRSAKFQIIILLEKADVWPKQKVVGHLSIFLGQWTK